MYTDLEKAKKYKREWIAERRRTEKAVAQRKKVYEAVFLERMYEEIEQLKLDVPVKRRAA